MAFNSILQIVLYAPMGTFFINIVRPPTDPNYAGVDVRYRTVATSVVVFLGIPLAAAIMTRVLFIWVLKKKEFFNRVVLPCIGPLSLIGLLFTTLIIFAAQGNQVGPGVLRVDSSYRNQI